MPSAFAACCRARTSTPSSWSSRRHLIPKALHANMFLVRHANEIMVKDVLVLPAETDFDAFLRLPEHAGGMKHIVVTRNDRIYGVMRVNTALRRGLEAAYTGVTLGDIAQRDFTLAREEPGPITEAAAAGAMGAASSLCWPISSRPPRRGRRRRMPPGSPLAHEAVRRIDLIFDAERALNGLGADIRWRCAGPRRCPAASSSRTGCASSGLSSRVTTTSSKRWITC